MDFGTFDWSDETDETWMDFGTFDWSDETDETWMDFGTCDWKNVDLGFWTHSRNQCWDSYGWSDKTWKTYCWSDETWRDFWRAGLNYFSNGQSEFYFSLYFLTGTSLYMKPKLNHFEGRNGRNRVEMFRPKTP